MNNKPYYPIIKESHSVVKGRISTDINIELHTILTATRLNGEKYEYDVIRRRVFKESSTSDNIKAIAQLYQILLIDVNNSINNIIINTDIKDTFGTPIFRRVDIQT